MARPMGGAGISVQDAVKRYSSSDPPVLRELSMEIMPGEFVTLLGPSGSGKSTLLNIIAGLDSLSSGRLIVDGADVSGVPAHRRGFGMVFQSYALFPHLTVAENVGYPLRVRHYSASERASRVAQILRLVDLTPLADRRPGQLSGGQQQRVSLARAMVFEPKVLLMDEPLGALDRNLRQSLQHEIRQLQQRTMSTVVYVTHDHDEAMSMSDRIALLSDGKIVQMGTPDEIYSDPVNAYAARALGETSLLPVRVVRDDGPRKLLRLQGSDQTFSLCSQLRHTTGYLAVRPEAVTTSDSPGADLVGMVKSKAFMGSNWRYQIEIDGSILVAAFPATSARELREGDRIGVTLDKRAVRVVA